MAEKPWTIRAVQLDLARQMETLEFIERFIDFIARFDYNTLVLYLEGRVRTASFPYPSPSQSYSPDEMKRIVAYAARKGIDVVPAVQAAAHAELFLQHPELAELWELHETGGRGRWKGLSRHPDIFCPSRPQTRAFLDAYFRDLAAVFPSPWFHAGLDEAWHLGICPACREHPDGQAGVFGDLVLWLHALVSDRLGKRLMLWDDMFERYPQALERTPRDVVLCCWHYDPVVHPPRHHFSTCRENFPAKYRRMGFDTLVSPADGTLNNVITFTDYAKPAAPLGGLVTTWEKQTSFLFESYPVIAYAGRAWKAPEQNGEALARACFADLFGIGDPPFIDAVLAAKNQGLGYPLSDPDRYLRGPEDAAECAVRLQAPVLEGALSGCREKVAGGVPSDVLDDMLARLAGARLHADLRRFVPAACGSDPVADAAGAAALAERVRVLGERRLRQWARFRPGLDDSAIHGSFETLERKVRALGAGRRTGLLTIRCFMPFIQQDSRLSIRYAGEAAWQTVAERRLCPLHGEPFYRIDFPVALDKAPEAVRFSTWGYGFQGVCHISVSNARGRFVPDGVTDLWGEVRDPLHILVDDDRWVMAGAPWARESYSDLPGVINQVEHGMEIRLRVAAGDERVTRYGKDGGVG